MSDRPRFPWQVAWTLGVAAVAAAFPLYRWGTAEIVAAVGAGALISTVNALAGYMAIERTIHRSHTTFLKAVIGGMGIRMAGMLGAMAFCLAVLKLHTIAFVASLLGLYTVFLVLEILYLQTMVNTHRE